MISLQLTNFKQHKSLSVEFPKTGLIRIVGPSGIGKSTIFEAIDYVINGTGSDVVTWGEPSAKVEMVFHDFGMCIIRTSRPNYLKVSISSQEFNEDLAQEMIYKTLGITAEEFDTTVYVRQEMRGSILSLGPADQLRFIQKLTESSIDPDRLKKHLSMEIQSSLSKKDSISNRLDILNKQLFDLKQEIMNLSSISPPEPPTDAVIPGIQNEISNTEVRLKSLLQERSEAISVASEAGLFEARRSEKAQSLINIEAKKALLWGLQSRKIFIEEKIKTLKTEKYYTDALEFFDLKSKANSVLQSSKIPVNSVSALVTYCETEINILQKKRSDLSYNIDTLREEIAGLEDMNGVECPHCNKSVLQTDAGLLPFSDSVRQDEIKAKTSSLEELALQLELVGSKLDGLSRIWSSLSPLVSRIKTLMKTMVTKPESEADTVKEKEELSLLKDELLSVGMEIGSSERELRSLQAKVDDLEKNLNNQKVTRYIDDISKDVDIVEEKLRVLHQKKAKSDSAGRAHLVYAAALDSYQKVEANLQKNISKKEGIDSEIQSLSNDFKELESKIKKLIILSDIAQKSATAAVDNVIQMINSSAQKYLDRMFGDQLVIELTSSVTTQKGDERAKIGLNITYQGQPVKNLKSLSGGQRSRAGLAFQLGLSDLYNFPFLMIDEGLTGVDLEAQSECIGFLQEFSQQKLILMIEHHAESAFFDKEVIL